MSQVDADSLTTYAMPEHLPETIFRAYDIRGTVPDLLNEQSVYAIGLAIGERVQEKGESSVIVGRDGRLSGPSLSQALISGLRVSGCDVINIGAVPTPVLYFATHHLATRSGVMLTGSHNPMNYNGLKMVIAGETISGDGIHALWQRLQTPIKPAKTPGKLTHTCFVEAYLNTICTDVKLARPLKIVIDCGNGIPGAIAPKLFERLGCEVETLYCEVDGHFPNHHPDPSVDENLSDLIARVKAVDADCGLAFDGDGDRIGVVTKKGVIIRADRQLMLYAKDILSRHTGATIIYDVKCSKHCDDVIKASGGHPLMWKTGHSFVKAKLNETGALLAGEMSGHVFFKERWFGFDDGLYTGARLLEILSSEERDADAVFQTIPDSVNTPELKIAVPDSEKFSVMARIAKSSVFADGKVSDIDGIRVDFSDGWGLVRVSNTTPYLVARFEADSETALERIKVVFRQQLLSAVPDLVLPF